jgi:hypothetical protein
MDEQESPLLHHSTLKSSFLKKYNAVLRDEGEHDTVFSKEVIPASFE